MENKFETEVTDFFSNLQLIRWPIDELINSYKARSEPEPETSNKQPASSIQQQNCLTTNNYLYLTLL